MFNVARRLFAWLRRFDGLFSVPDGLSLNELDALFKRRTKKIQLWLIIIFGSIIYYCIEGSSPNYSVTAYVHSAAPVASAASAADYFPSKNIIKIGFLAFIIFVLWVQISFNDPFGNNPYLNSVARGSNNPNRLTKFLWPGYYSDIRAFAHVMPSSQIGRLCSDCKSQQACTVLPSVESLRDEYSLRIWRAIFNDPDANRDAYGRVLATLLKCRSLAYLRVALRNCVCLSVASYLVHRILELYVFQRPPHWNSVVLVVVGSSMVLSLLLSAKNNSSGGLMESGVWAQLRQASKDFLDDSKMRHRFEEIYKDSLCRRPGSIHQFERAGMNYDLDRSNIEGIRDIKLGVYDHIDRLLLGKLVRIASGPQKVASIKHHLSVILSLQDFLSSRFDQLKLTAEFVRAVDIGGYWEGPAGGFGSRVRKDISRNQCAAYHQQDMVNCGKSKKMTSCFVFGVQLRDGSVAALSHLCRNNPDLLGRFEFGILGYIVVWTSIQDADLSGSVRALREAVAPFALRVVMELQREHLRKG